MFIHKKRFFIGLLATVGIFSFAEAAVPEAPGPYVGVTDINNSSVTINSEDNSDNEDGFYVSIYKYPSLALFDTINVNESNSSQIETTVTGLTCNQTYKAVVMAYNNEGNSSSSDDSYFNIESTFGVDCGENNDTNEIPNAPGAYVGVTDINNSSVIIDTADNSNNEDGFYVSIYKYPSLALFDTINVNESNNSQIETTVTGLTCNQTYKAVVMAYNNEGNSSSSDDSYFNIESTFGVDCGENNDTNEIPNAPGAYVGVTDINNSSVIIDTADNSNNEDGFYVSIYKYPSLALFDTINVNESNNSHMETTVTGLTCNQTYKAVVVAYNNEGNSSASDDSYFNIESTFGVDCGENNDTNEVPNAPGAYVGVTDINNSSVTINTADNSDNEDGFYVSIYKYPSLALFDTINVNESNNSHMETTVTGLTCNQTYKAVVVAYNNEGNSSARDDSYFNIESTFGVDCGENNDTNEVPNAPGAYVGVTDINNSSVTINTADNSDNEDGFYVSIYDGSTLFDTIKVNGSDNSQMQTTVTGLTCNQTYKAVVVAYNAEGNSSASDDRYFNIKNTFGVDCNE